MGTTQSFRPYATPALGAESESDSTVFRSSSHPDGLVDGLLNAVVRNGWDLFKLGQKISHGGPFLGHRVLDASGEPGDYSWLSYNEVERLAIQIGSGLQNLQCLPEIEFPDEIVPCAKACRIVGIFSKNRPEWLIMEQAANAFGFTNVPLYDTLGADALSFILKQTQMTSVVCSAESLEILLTISDGTSLKHVICLDKVSESMQDHVESRNFTLLYWEDIIKSGKQHTLPINPPPPDGLHTICYTSGTTGNPKGVLQTHRNFVSVVSAGLRGPLSGMGIDVRSTDIHISYLPLAHVFERIICNLVIASGGGIGFYGGNALKLLDDLKVLRPTIFISVPRLFNRIDQRVMSGLADKQPVVQYLFQLGMKSKLARLRETGLPSHALWDRLVFNKTRQLLGGRVRYLVTGGAPLGAAVQERISCIFCAPIMEGYGMTETMGASFITDGIDPVKGSVGGPLPCNEFKLVSVPEMDYIANDDPPRGELCIRGNGVTPGYFRNPELTKQLVDANGWLHTGDVCMLLPNTSIKIIDRAKSMFKLSQGEYVSPEKIEQAYAQAMSVSQVFSFGYSDQNCLVGIVVPEPEWSFKWAARKELANVTLEDLCSNQEFKEAIETEMAVAVNTRGLKGFEKLKAIRLEAVPFSVDNGLLTPTYKIRRSNAKAVYKTHIDSMYEAIGA